MTEAEARYHAEDGGKAKVVTAAPNQGCLPSKMDRPRAPEGTPQGLEYLLNLNQLMVRQQVELLEAVTGYETQNKYEVRNVLGQQIYLAAEESACCGRQCCGSRRAFVIHLTDTSGTEIMRVHRDFSCCGGCCWFATCCCCCESLITIEAPPGVVLGKTMMKCSAWAPRYEIYDHQGKSIFNITGPCCTTQCCCCPFDKEFKIFGTNDQQVAFIKKTWAGCVQESHSDADNFTVSFPQDLDIRMKAVLLCTVFLIDFNHYESGKNDKKK